MTLLHDFINNYAILVLLVFAYSRLYKYLQNHALYRQLMNGALFGIIGLAVMIFPIHFQPGLIFDSRTIVISASGLFCGPIGAIISVSVALVYRIALGGVGMITGVATIISSALIGVGYHYLRKKYARAMEPQYIFMFGLVVHLVMMLCMFFLPFDLTLQTYRVIGPYIIIFYPIISFVTIHLLHQVEREFLLEKNFKYNLENYRELVENSGSIILRIKPDCTITFINGFAQKFFGFSYREIIGHNLVGTIVPEKDSQGKDLAVLMRDMGEHTERYRQNQNENIRKDGTRCWLAWSNTPLYNANGKCTEIICVGVDITQRKMLELKLETQNAELEKSRLEYSMLFRNMTVAFASHAMIYDANGKPCDYRFLRVNPAFEKITGLSASELIGKTVKEVLPDTEDYWIETYGQVALTGRPAAFQNYSREFGRYFDVIAFSPGKDVFATIFSDITEQKHAEIRRNLSTRVLTLLNNKNVEKDIITRLVEMFKDFSSADGVGIRLRNGNSFPYSVAVNLPETAGTDKKTLCEPLVENTVSRDSKDMVKHSCICSAVIARNLDRKLSGVTEHGSFWTNQRITEHPEISAVCANPDQCGLSACGSFALIPIVKEKVTIGLIQFNFKKTDRVSRDFVEFFESISQSIAIAIARIEDFAQLEQARRKAEAASHAKNEFLSMMSHELRTPLSGIIGFSGLIDECLHQTGEFEQKKEIAEYIEIVRESGNTLTEIINDILDLSSIEARQSTITTVAFNPHHLINECLKAFKFKVEAKKLYLKFYPDNLPETVTGPAKILKQILFNLIGNAVKFTRNGGVEVLALYRQNKLLFSVKDTGIGIPSELRKKVLEPFTQVDQSSTRRYGGTGLGLTIVKRSLEQLGGTLDIAGQVGEGTTVSFSLPIKLPFSATPPSSSESEENPENIKDKKILVIEDSQVSILYLNHILKNVDAQYVIAQSFAEMKNICEQGFTPDIALIDIALPDADGFDCLKWLRNHFPDKSIRCIAQTAHVLKEHTRQYQEAGFDAFIGKPFRLNELLQILTVKSSMRSPNSQNN